MEGGAFLVGVGEVAVGGVAGEEGGGGFLAFEGFGGGCGDGGVWGWGEGGEEVGVEGGAGVVDDAGEEAGAPGVVAEDGGAGAEEGGLGGGERGGDGVRGGGEEAGGGAGRGRRPRGLVGAPGHGGPAGDVGGELEDYGVVLFGGAVLGLGHGEAVVVLVDVEGAFVPAGVSRGGRAAGRGGEGAGGAGLHEAQQTVERGVALEAVRRRVAGAALDGGLAAALELEAGAVFGGHVGALDHLPERDAGLLLPRPADGLRAVELVGRARGEGVAEGADLGVVGVEVVGEGVAAVGLVAGGVADEVAGDGGEGEGLRGEEGVEEGGVERGVWFVSGGGAGMGRAWGGIGDIHSLFFPSSAVCFVRSTNVSSRFN